MPEEIDIAIIGAGPAGLMAAEVLAGAGRRVTVFDRMASPARKFLIAGRGGLNLTHSEPLERFLPRYREAETWLAPSIHAFTPDDLRRWCESLGEETFIGSSGRVFPKSMKAVQLLRAWLRRLEKQGVEYRPRHHWQGWEDGSLRFATESSPVSVQPRLTLLALGGASWPRLGSDGQWVAHFPAEDISPLRPANGGFQVNWSPLFVDRFAGQPLKPVTLHHQGLSRQGEAMISAQGIEGGAVYALSAELREAIARDGQATLHLDLRPGMAQDALAKKLSGLGGSKSLSNLLRGAGFSPLAIGLLRECGEPPSSPAALAARLKSLPLVLTGTTGLARAISSAGGLRRHALDENFMLKARPGVFLAGEMLDWEAPTGGYLLQACFSTAVAAAQAMLRYNE